jgi:Integrase core domain
VLAADNAMMESFWGRMQVELFNRRRWKTRIELASGIHDYLQFHNTRRRHSALEMRTPIEIEAIWLKSQDERLPAKTAPNQVVDERLAAGLFDPSGQVHHQDHLELLENNDQAA